jgi:hypothetical protein
MNEDATIQRMIAYGRSLIGVGRGQISDDFIATYKLSNVGPVWSLILPDMPTRERIDKEGILCIGLISLCLRHVGLVLPFLFNPPYEDLINGFGGTDEWLYFFRNQVEIFSEHGQYPVGTLLFRVYNLIDQGHVALLIESSYAKEIMNCKVLQSAGQPLGTGMVDDKALVRDQQLYYSRGTKWNWDDDDKFCLTFKDQPYYTHILRPDVYLQQCFNIN